MQTFKTFIKENYPIDNSGYTAELWLHHKHGPIVHIIKRGNPISEAARDWNLPTVTGDEGYAHFGEFKPTNLDDHEQTMKEFHEHLFKHGIFTDAEKHPMHKTPHMQRFEDRVHDIIGEGRKNSRKDIDWHSDSTGSAGGKDKETGKPNPAPRDAAVYSSSGASTKIGRPSPAGVEELHGATKPGTVAVFDDYTMMHKAPSKEERADRHFIRAGNIQKIPTQPIKRTNAKTNKQELFDLNTEEGQQRYIATRGRANTQNMHNNLHKKIRNFITDNPNPEKGSVNHKKQQALLAHINSSENKPLYNSDGWLEEHIATQRAKALANPEGDKGYYKKENYASGKAPKKPDDAPKDTSKKKSKEKL